MAHSATHHEISTIKRSAGQSATARLAYVCRSEIHDDRTGETHRYRDKDGSLGEIQTIGFNGDPADFANELEAAEKRKDAQVGRSSILALPHELDAEAQARVVRAYQQHNLDRYGCASVSAIHREKGNHHAHIVEGTRDRDGKKITALSNKKTSAAEVEHRRSTWAELVNAELDRAAPAAEKVDHRSLARRAAAGDPAAVGREPIPHAGPAAHRSIVRAMRKKQPHPRWAVRRLVQIRTIKEARDALLEAARRVRLLEREDDKARRRQEAIRRAAQKDAERRRMEQDTAEKRKRGRQLGQRTR